MCYDGGGRAYQTERNQRGAWHTGVHEIRAGRNCAGLISANRFLNKLWICRMKWKYSIYYGHEVKKTSFKRAKCFASVQPASTTDV